MDQAFEYLEWKKLLTESDYSYTGKDGKCSYDSSKGVVHVSSYNDVEKNNADQLKAALAKGPVSVAVEANYSWQVYTGGVTDPCGSGTPQLNHGVLAVGYSDG